MNLLEKDEEINPGLPANRHFGRLGGWGHQDQGCHELNVDFQGRPNNFERENLVALQHLTVVDPWLEEHKTLIAKKYSLRGQQRTDAEIIREHNIHFT